MDSSEVCVQPGLREREKNENTNYNDVKHNELAKLDSSLAVHQLSSSSNIKIGRKEEHSSISKDGKGTSVKVDHSSRSTKKLREEEHSGIDKDKVSNLKDSLSSSTQPQRDDHSIISVARNKMSLPASLAPPAKRFKDMDSTTEIQQDKSQEQFTPRQSLEELATQQYLAEEKALGVELDNFYSAYIDVPELHPSYIEKYNEFLKNRGVTGSESRAEWVEYWRTELEKMKKIELAERKKPIVTKYRQMLAAKNTSRSNADSEPSTSKGSPVTSSIAAQFNKKAASNKHTSAPKLDIDYNVLDSFVVLEGLTDHIGLVGVALKGLIDLARNAGSTTKKAFDLLLQDDNVTLMNLCISKLRDELTHALPPFSVQLNQGVEHAEKLLKFAAEEVKRIEEAAPNKGDFGLALQAIAKATEGRSSSYIVDFIKCSLDLQGAVYDKKDLNELFLAVSSLHFEMSLNARSQSFSDVSPESKSQIHGLTELSSADEPSSFHQIRNAIDSQFAPVQLDRDSSKNVQDMQSTRLMSSSSVLPLFKGETSSQQRSAYHSGSRSTKSETSSQQHNNIYSDMQSTKFLTSLQERPTNHSGYQLTTSEASSLQHPTDQSGMYSTVSEVRMPQHPTNHSGRQSTYFSPGAHQHLAQSTSSALPPNELPVYQHKVQLGTPTGGTSSSYDQSPLPTVSSQYCVSLPSSASSRTISPQHHAEQPGSESTSTTAVGFKDHSRSKSTSWFVNKVKSIVNLPHLTLAKFNKELTTILEGRPVHYKFSRNDLLIVKELQTLGSMNVSETLFLSTLKGKFLEL